jgi:hypothetical protein
LTRCRTTGIESSFFICGDAASSFRTEEAAALDLEIVDIEEEKGEDDYIAKGKVANHADALASGAWVYAVFRDHSGRYAGFAWASLDRPIPPGKSMAFSLDVNVNTLVPVDPFDFIESDYSVDLGVGPSANVHMIMC